ncbi:MAG: DUF1801 domain-containing protein [Bacteroidia bacterium]|jgi:uncharacterized protein YdhG (YjbR/CyaY superfamily)|nr:DUF1801 domain-containing protein [Bacteroidia bacterium]
MNVIENYINQFDEPVKSRLYEMRAIILAAAPQASETISYGMPAFKQGKILVYFAGYQKHIGLYPHASPIIKFAEELRIYKTSKGAIQFPIDKPLPKRLIQKIVKYRLQEMMHEAKK